MASEKSERAGPTLAEPGDMVYGTLMGRTGWWVASFDGWKPSDPPEKVGGRLVRPLRKEPR